MYYETMPLYPPMGADRDCDNCVRVPVFGEGRPGPGALPDERFCRRVMIENPCRPGECAEVLLGVDSCGNLTVCVRREPRRDCERRPPRPQRPCRPSRPCLPEPCPPRHGCRGRLYGSWR